jgi:hypothetical protein
MSEYTVDDIITTEVAYERREWWPDCARLGRLISEFRYFQDKALCFSTKDGKYTTGAPDIDSGSYWYETVEPRVRLGTYAYDYVFGCTSGLEGAVERLNKLVKEYQLMLKKYNL